MSNEDKPRKARELPPQPITRTSLAFYAFCRMIVVGLSHIFFPGPVIGAEKLPADGTYVLAPVHRSNLDWLIVARVTKRRLRYLVKDEVWKVPPVGKLLELLGAFPVHRASADRQALNRALEVLKAGEPLVLFPEGTRREGAEIGEILEGAAYLALRGKATIFPVGLAGTDRAMPRGKKLPRAARVQIVIGDPIAILVAATPESGSEGATKTRISRSVTHAHNEALREGMQRAFAQATSRLHDPTRVSRRQ